MSEGAPSNHKRPVRIYMYSTWATDIQDAAEYLSALPTRDIRNMVVRPDDADLVRLGKLNCDWEGENLRAFASMEHPDVEFLPARIVGTPGLSEMAKTASPAGEECWLVFIAQQPQIFGESIGKMLKFITKRGYRLFYWAFDEASRNLATFKEGVAPYTSILVHDETPLDDSGKAALMPGCLTYHESWVANIVPFAHPFYEDVEEKIVFLGSKKGLFHQRQKQIEFLQDHYKEKFKAFHDHTVSIQDRAQFGRYKVHLCPEGRHFTTPGMSKTHTDRPFWSGCLGQVPVVENSKWGDRMNSWLDQKAIIRYEHGDLKSLVEACDKALAASMEERRASYNYFNKFGTIGPIAARLLAEYRRSQL